VDDREVILLQREEPALHTVRQLRSRGGHERESTVIGQHGEGGAKQVRVKIADTPHDRKALEFHDGVAFFGRFELAAGEGDRAFALIELLRQDRADGRFGGVAREDEGPRVVGECEDGRGREALLQGAEGGQTLGGPVEAVVLASQGREGSSNGSIVVDEGAVVASEAQELADLERGCGDIQVAHGVDFRRVDGQAGLGEHVAEILGRGAAEAALVEAKVEGRHA